MDSLKKNILSQEYYSDSATQRLVGILESEIGGLDGATVYYHFPMIRELDEEMKYPSLLVVSPHHGVILFRCDAISRDRDSEIELMTDELLRIEELIFSKLIKSPNKKLKKGRRDLSFNLCSALYVPNLIEVQDEESEVEILRTNAEIKSFFEDMEDEIEDEVIREIYSILDSSSAIVKPKEREVGKGDTSSKAFMLKKLEEEIAVFDDEQKYAALSQLEGPQRIRGLAGSGKTIILCMKAAILHLKYPNKKILYTFMTKSLYDYIELLITRFYKVLGDGHLPDFKNSINIMHAWGGDNLKGVYYDSCRRNGVEPITFRNAAAAVGTKEAFDYICKDLLEKTKGNLEKVYDYVLLDEAQDFKPSFYQICRAIVKNDCIVWCYDNLQNIFDVTIQDTMSTFRNQYGAEGINLVALQRQYPDMDNDIVLPKSYRNPREILVTAHALGFGVYNDKLIQSLENNAHWEDLGYVVEEGESNPGDYMVIDRPLENSPLSISQYQKPNEIIEVYSAESFSKEINWVCNSIQRAIKVDGLRPDDIIVISLDDRNSKHYFNEIGDTLYKMGIFSHNLSSNFYEKGFIEDERVTLSTVYKAKGHEAPMVFVIGCDVFEGKKDERNMRNKVFTSFTRAKAWLRISGINIAEDSIVSEIRQVIANDFKMKFYHKESHVIQRDLNEEHVRKAALREMIQETIQKARKAGFSPKEIDKLYSEIQEGIDSGSDES